jgi:hypothetical protein
MHPTHPSATRNRRATEACNAGNPRRSNRCDQIPLQPGKELRFNGMRRR